MHHKAGDNKPNKIKLCYWRILQRIPRRLRLEYITLIISAGLSVFLFAPFTANPIVVAVVLIPFIYILTNQPTNTSTKKILSYGYIYGLLFFNSQLYWMFYSLYAVIKAGFFVSLFAIIAFTLFLSTYTALMALTYVRLKTKSYLFNVALLFPSLWVIAEWLRGWLFSGFAWCSLGYTQVESSSFSGIFPILGNYGVSFMLLGILGCLIYLAQNKLRNYHVKKLESDVSTKAVDKQLLSPPSTFNVLLVLFYFGLWVVSITNLSVKQYTKPYGTKTSVALIQGNVSTATKWHSLDYLDIYTDILKKVKADIIFIPETAIATFEQYLPEDYLSNLTDIARQKNANLIVGMPVIIDEQNNYVNAAILLTNQNHPYYAKSHLVPYGEYIPARWLLARIYKDINLPMVNYTAGSSTQEPLVAANQLLAFNICYENVFNTDLISTAKNATIMVNLSEMIWYGNTFAKDQHLQMSQARALENQRYFVQATNSGVTAIIKPDGKIQSRLPAFKRMILTDYVEGRIGETPFEKYGNSPIVLFALLWILIAMVYRCRLKCLSHQL